MKTKIKPKKRNPQDLTLRNLRALKKDVDLLGLRISNIYVELTDKINSLEKKLRK